MGSAKQSNPLVTTRPQLSQHPHQTPLRSLLTAEPGVRESNGLNQASSLHPPHQQHPHQDTTNQPPHPGDNTAGAIDGLYKAKGVDGLYQAFGLQPPASNLQHTQGNTAGTTAGITSGTKADGLYQSFGLQPPHVPPPAGEEEDAGSYDTRSQASDHEDYGYRCDHESHDHPPAFATAGAKLEHVIRNHRCIFATLPQRCSFYSEHQSAMDIHMLKTHAKHSHICEICDRKFEAESNLIEHLQDHPNCPACGERFLSSQQLYSHHPTCRGRTTEQAMAAPSDQLGQDSGLGPLLRSLILAQGQGPFDPRSREIMLSEVADYERQHAIERQRLIQGNTCLIKNDEALFDLPECETNSSIKEEIGKITQFFKPEAAFRPEQGRTLESSIRNYFTFKEVLM